MLRRGVNPAEAVNAGKTESARATTTVDVPAASRGESRRPRSGEQLLPRAEVRLEEPRRAVKGRPRALSTGRAASYCLVTADTIANWIKRNRLPARRTVGGQYRILVHDLREFMVEQGMETDLLDAAYDARRYCWEYCEGAAAGPLLGSSCDDCLVRRVQALNCFELRSALSSGADDFEACATCRYLAEWRLGKGNGSSRYRDAVGEEAGARESSLWGEP